MTDVTEVALAYGLFATVHITDDLYAAALHPTWMRADDTPERRLATLLWLVRDALGRLAPAQRTLYLTAPLAPGDRLRVRVQVQRLGVCQYVLDVAAHDDDNEQEENRL